LPDGEHNFDFDLRPLKLHLSRLQRPRTGSSKWSGLDGTELDGTGVVRIFWAGVVPDAHHFEQSYPDGGGRTWEPSLFADVMVADVTRAES
jgi:hypothetical protein